MTSTSPTIDRDSIRQVRVLLLTYYFPPDQTPGAFRSKALLEALLSFHSGDPDRRVVVDVMTTQPNRYPTSQATAYAEEIGDGFRIRRLDVRQTGPGYAGQAQAFLSFAQQVNAAVASASYDIVVATTSRQMTGLLGALIARRKGMPLYLDIRDLFAHNTKSMFHWSLRPIAWLIAHSERWMLAQAARVNVVSMGFLPYLEKHVSDYKLSYFPNGVDDLFIGLDPHQKIKRSGPTEVVYAGNIGAGQGLHRVIPELALRLKGDAHFTIIGDGQQIGLLRSAIERRELSNVTLLDPVPREQLAEIYSKADILFLHLGEAASLNLVLPSKIFEYAATGRPILAGTAGYTARFIAEEIQNAAVFPPGDVEAALKEFRSLENSFTQRSSFISRFARRAIMKGLAEDIMAVIK